MNTEVITFLLALPASLFAFYIAIRKINFIAAVGLFGAPIVVNGIDVFVNGNLTLFRESAFALWSFCALYIVMHRYES